MSKQLVTAVTVNVTDDDGSVSAHPYQAGETPSAEHAKLISNPAAFDMDEWSRDSVTHRRTIEPGPLVEADGEPPRGGPGSGREAWAEYAATLGIEFDDDASRDDIVVLVDASRS